MKFLISCFFAFVYVFPTFAADDRSVLELKSGKKIIGIIVEQVPGKYFKVKKEDGSIEELPSDSVVIVKKEELPAKDLMKNPYWYWGASIGSPAAFNALVGKWQDRFGWRVSGMYLGMAEIFGIEAGLTYRLKDTVSWGHYFNLLAGHSEITDREFNSQLGDFGEFEDVQRIYRYIGLSYTLGYKGFFADVGYSAGSRTNWDFRNGLLLQIGFRSRLFE